MKSYEFNMGEDTIVGISSGMGGGIGIIRMSGEESLFFAGKIFRTKKYIEDTDSEKIWKNDYFIEKPSHTIHYGFVVDQEETVIDEVMVSLMMAPRSYTKENVVEINCHGGVFVMQKIMDLLVKQGARLADQGEFTKRAFLNGRIDLSQAEAVMKMISSQNDFALKSAVNQLEGALSKKIEKIRQRILHNLGFIEAALDDPEHISLDGYSDKLLTEIREQIKQLNCLLDNFNDGRMKSEGINTVIVGRPNAGKSSLMNLILDEDRAIVTDIAGTTRDVLEEKVILGNIILNLVDTAGIHDTEDVVEHLGVNKAVHYLEEADFVIYVVDASESLCESDHKIISMLKGKQGVVLLNKSDLQTVVTKEEIVNLIPWDVIPFSNETGDGLKQLEEYIRTSFLKGDITYNDQIYLTSLRHKEAVEAARDSLLQVIQTIEDGMPEDFYTIDMMDAYKKLGLIHGDTAEEDLINKIFKDFCMGK